MKAYKFWLILVGTIILGLAGCGEKVEERTKVTINDDYNIHGRMVVTVCLLSQQDQEKYDEPKVTITTSGTSDWGDAPSGTRNSSLYWARLDPNPPSSYVINRGFWDATSSPGCFRAETPQIFIDTEEWAKYQFCPFETINITVDFGNQLFEDHKFVCSIPASDTSSEDGSSQSSDFPVIGLVAFFPFSGDAEDASGNGNDGNVSGARLVSDRFGHSESAYEFDGDDDYIQVTDPRGIPLGDSPRTVAFWMKANELLPNDYQVMVVYGDFSENHLWGIGLDFNGQKLYVSQFGAAVFGNPPPQDEWLFVAVTYDGSNYRLYENGELINSGSMRTNTQKGDLTIGTQFGVFQGSACGQNGACPFSGSIDDLVVYDRELSDDEVMELYELSR